MTTKIFEPTFNEITEFETEVNNLLKKFNTPTKTRKFRIELIDKSSFRIFKCCNIILPADTVMVMTIEMRNTGATNVPTAFPITSVILRDAGTIEAIPGRNRTEPDCFLLCAGARLVERYLDSFSTDFKSDITMRSSTPEMGPGWLNPKKMERRVSATPFSTIPRFSSTKQLTRQPRVEKEHALPSSGGSVALHFSRREFPRPKKLH